MLPKTAWRLPRSSDDVRRRRSSGRSSAWRWRRHGPLHQSLTISCAPSRDGSRGASRDPVEHSEDTGGHMTTLSLDTQLTGRGKTILARAISGRLFAGSKEDGGHNVEAAELARVHPLPAPVETAAELRTRLALAEERLTELKAMLEDMRRDRDAWREQAQMRLLPAPPLSWRRWLRTTG